MQLTKLRAAPERQDKVPPCAPAGRMDGGTASQLIRSVRRTFGGAREVTRLTGISLVGLLLLSASGPGPSVGEDKPPTPAVTAGVCETLSKELFGRPATRPTGKIRQPKKLHDVSPKYPEIPAGTVGRGNWVGEAVIGPDGRVRGVSVLRDLKFTPPFPAFSQAIQDAIRQWRYTPTLVDGNPVPVCMTISVEIYWTQR
jgi:outer membrane biosynthesis protein TonB